MKICMLILKCGIDWLKELLKDVSIESIKTTVEGNKDDQTKPAPVFRIRVSKESNTCIRIIMRNISSIQVSNICPIGVAISESGKLYAKKDISFSGKTLSPDQEIQSDTIEVWDIKRNTRIDIELKFTLEDELYREYVYTAKAESIDYSALFSNKKSTWRITNELRRRKKWKKLKNICLIVIVGIILSVICLFFESKEKSNSNSSISKDNSIQINAPVTGNVTIYYNNGMVDLFQSEGLAEMNQISLLYSESDDEYYRFNTYLDAAKLGDVNAMYTVGRYYMNGIEGKIEIDYKLARDWFEKAGDQADALNALGNLQYNGYGDFTEDHEQACLFYQQAVDRGSSEAAFSLGIAYYKGDGVREDKEQAIKLFKTSANLGNVRAMYNVGVFYAQGIVVEKDTHEAFNWFYKAALESYAPAQNNLGIMYYRGEEVQQSYEMARYYYSLAAEQNNDCALFNLGSMYLSGIGVQQSDTVAFEYFSRSADYGNAAALYSLGNMYENGNGVNSSDEKAAEYYRLAADKGFAEAQCAMGYMYENGKGVEKSDIVAVEYYRLAANQGYSRGQYRLGIMYQYGKGVEESYTVAEEYYKLAVKQNYANARIGLGDLYSYESYGMIDLEQAIMYYMQVVDDNNIALINRTYAMKRLGGIFNYEGFPEIKNIKTSLYWYQRAVDAGDEEAREVLNQILSE